MANPVTRAIEDPLIRIMMAVATLLSAAVLGYACREPNSQPTATAAADDGTSTTTTNTTSPQSTSVTASTTPPTALASSTTSTTIDTDDGLVPPPGVAAQVYFPQGGATGYVPECSPGTGVIVDSALDSATHVPLEEILVCFADLAADAPVNIEITAPDGHVTTVTATVATDVPEPVPFLDFTRGPSDPTGTYQIQGVQGTQVRTASVTIEEPDRPIVEVMDINSDSVSVAAAGFPPSQTVGVHLYRQHDPERSTYDWVQSSLLETDERGHGQVQILMPPAIASLNGYGILTDPRGLSALLEEVLFNRPP